MSIKGGQQVGPSVGTFSRLKQENRDLKAEVERLKDLLAADRVALGLHQELQTAAEDIGGPGDWFHKDIRPAIHRLHRAIRKVRGMK